MSIAKNIFLIIASPKMGWDEVNESGFTTQKVLQSGFYPLLALLAIVSFAPMLLDSEEWSLTRAIIHAIAECTSFLVTFYFSSYLLGSFYPELVKSNSATSRLNNYILYNLSFLIILEAFLNIINFTPFYLITVYLPVIASKGLDFLGIKDEKKGIRFTIFASILFIGGPYIVRKLLEFMIPIGN